MRTNPDSPRAVLASAAAAGARRGRRDAGPASLRREAIGMALSVIEQVFYTPAFQIMQNYKASQFEYEASVRYAIRSSLCIFGWSFDDAESIAERVTNEVLFQMQARRPTWDEGQPDWCQTGIFRADIEFCKNCGQPLEDKVDWRQIYCSVSCRRSSNDKQFIKRHREEFLIKQRIQDSTRRKKERQAMPEKKCPTCSKLFRPSPRRGTNKEQEYCSKSCWYKSGEVGQHLKKKKKSAPAPPMAAE